MSAKLKFALCAAAAASALAAVPAAAEQGDFLVRVRGIVVAPTEKSTPILPTFPTASVGVSNSVVGEVDFSYFFTKHIAAELILATSPHDIQGQGALSNLKIADVTVLPPTVTLQYHFAPRGKIDPYVGVGLNYTIFYNEDTSDELDAAIGPTAIGLSDNVSYAFQAGVDYKITDRWFFNADIKYINLDTTATLTTGNLVNRVGVHIDPIVAGIGFGYRF